MTKGKRSAYLASGRFEPCLTSGVGFRRRHGAANRQLTGFLCEVRELGQDREWGAT
jgi:hypothetical protein